MQVYIEYVILDNFIMDYLLIKETSILLRLKYKRLRIVFGAVVGTVGATILPLLKIKPEFAFILKILLGMVICVVSTEYNGLGKFIRFFNVFLLLTFLLGGAVIGVFYVLGIDIKSYGSDFIPVLPVGVSVGCGYLSVIVVKKAVKKAVNGVITDRFRYSCIIKYGTCVVKVNGFYDSGNLLFDGKSGLPIVLCKSKIIKKIQRENDSFISTRELDFSTVSSQGRIKLYAVDCILVEINGVNKRANCLLGEVDGREISEDLLLGAYVL